ncbi:MAG TPA: hypothetical protein VGU20_26635 [Stellaceae bacterium]|nr:hypothetical protein [Stellaceae bacterium]
MRLLALEQKDGTYFIRPFGDLPFVYHADKLVTGRLIKFYRKFNSWAFWGALLSGALSLPILLNFWSDDLLFATVIFMVGAWVAVAAGAIAGALFILRHASRVPATVFPMPKPKAEPARWRLLRVAATIATAFSVIGMFYLPPELPFSGWLQVAFIGFALIVFVADHVRRQREQSGAPPAPPRIDDRGRQRRRMLWGTLLAPLANPLALWMLVVLPLTDPDAFAAIDRVFRLVGLLLAASYGLGVALGLLLLLGWGRRSLWWYLGAGTVATLIMTPVAFSLLQPHFSAQLGTDPVLWLGTMTAVFIAFPAVITFWLIARPDRYVEAPGHAAA